MPDRKTCKSKEKNYSKKTEFTECLPLNDKSQKFLIKQDRLIQITDYSLEEINDSADYYVNEFLKSLPPIEYMKLEIKK